MNFSLGLDKTKATQESALSIANKVRDKMIRLAYFTLSPETAALYEASLSRVEMSNGEATFGIQGWLANAIENGVSAFDMKPGMMASPKVKISKLGNPYLRVPIKNSPLIIRTVTPSSNGWIFPGIVARHFFDMATYSLKLGGI